jgi:hypothetical protein
VVEPAEEVPLAALVVPCPFDYETDYETFPTVDAALPLFALVTVADPVPVYAAVPEAVEEAPDPVGPE